jgi:tRNA threonylcarbamoyladenosine biosynthesis protein TsaE
MIVETKSPKETYELGVKLGEKAVCGQVFGMVGDLGVGKTIFTQGFAKGLGIDEVVSSPTFMIVAEYKAGRLPFYHFDVYRIGDIEELEEIGFEEYLDYEGVVLVEWSNLVAQKMPPCYTVVKIEKDLDEGFDYRKITITKEFKDESIRY